VQCHDKHSPIAGKTHDPSKERRIILLLVHLLRLAFGKRGRRPGVHIDHRDESPPSRRRIRIGIRMIGIIRMEGSFVQKRQCANWKNGILCFHLTSPLSMRVGWSMGRMTIVIHILPRRRMRRMVLIRKAHHRIDTEISCRTPCQDIFLKGDKRRTWCQRGDETMR